MKLINATLISIATAFAVLASGAAFAHGGHFHGRVGVFIGGPVWSPWYYAPPPYYYYPPAPVVVSPPTYIEKGDDSAPADRSPYWYYCADSKAYYPYVKDCPGGWQRVAPQPPS